MKITIKIKNSEILKVWITNYTFYPKYLLPQALAWRFKQKS